MLSRVSHALIAFCLSWEAAYRFVITKLTIQTYKIVWQYQFSASVKSSSLNYGFQGLT